jgi:hemolysin III
VEVFILNNYIREPFNSLSHFVGAALSVIALILMITKAVFNENSILQITAVSIFGLSMILLYTTSATYHMILAKDQTIAFWRKLDHSMIYILIAGSYAPLCLIALERKTGTILFSIVALLAVAGILFKMVWFHSPRWLSTALYIGMGWIIVFLATPLSELLSLNGLLLLIGGGIMYTIGGVIYATKPNILKFFPLGFHEIFHIFILFGTLCHFLCVYFYVL